jgi:hypothetical protein
VAGRDEREPLKLPIGVLATPTMHTSGRKEKGTVLIKIRANKNGTVRKIRRQRKKQERFDQD